MTLWNQNIKLGLCHYTIDLNQASDSINNKHKGNQAMFKWMMMVIMLKIMKKVKEMKEMKEINDDIRIENIQ